MELKFNKQGTKYVAEFTATGDFNLHIEREKQGFILVQQRTTTSGKFDSISGGNFSSVDSVIDCDFIGTVYPKYIKVVSEVLPTFAELTFAD